MNSRILIILICLLPLSATAQPTGTETSSGLGLSIVKKFVLAMKGEIWCESECGKGASFFVSFKQSK